MQYFILYPLISNTRNLMIIFSCPQTITLRAILIYIAMYIVPVSESEMDSTGTNFSEYIIQDAKSPLDMRSDPCVTLR
jgi:hypothetical protein